MGAYETLTAELMDHRRSDMWSILALVIVSCAVVSSCWPSLVAAVQTSQDAINAVNQERFSEVFRRLDSIENLVRGVFVMLVSTLAALVVQIWNQSRSRKRF